MRLILLLFISFSSVISFGQNVGIGTNVPHALTDMYFPSEYWTSTGMKNIYITQFPDGSTVITPNNSEAFTFNMPINGAASANITPRSISYPVRAIRKF